MWQCMGCMWGCMISTEGPCLDLRKVYMSMEDEHIEEVTTPVARGVDLGALPISPPSSLSIGVHLSLYVGFAFHRWLYDAPRPFALPSAPYITCVRGPYCCCCCCCHFWDSIIGKATPSPPCMQCVIPRLIYESSPAT